MDKRLSIQVNCNRKLSGVLRGFDAFMNIVLDETIEECKTGNLPMGTVVRIIINYISCFIVFRFCGEIVS